MRRLGQWMSVVVFAVLVAALVVRRDDLGAAFAEIGRLDAAWYVLLASLIAVGIVVDGVYAQSVTPQLSIARAIMVQQAATASNNTVIGSGPVATGLRIAMMRSWGISDASIAVSILALNVIAAYRLWLIALATSIAGLAGADGGVLDTRVYAVVVVVASVVLSGSTLLWWVLLRHPIVAARIAGLLQRAWDRLRRRVVRLPDIGIVVTELGLAALLVRFGGAEAVVLAAVLTYRVLTFALPIVTGGMCFLAWRFEHRRPANEHLGDHWSVRTPR